MKLIQRINTKMFALKHVHLIQADSKLGLVLLHSLVTGLGLFVKSCQTSPVIVIIVISVE